MTELDVVTLNEVLSSTVSKQHVSIMFKEFQFFFSNFIKELDNPPKNLLNVSDGGNLGTPEFTPDKITQNQLRKLLHES